MKKNIYLELFLVFFKIGAFTIGGGYVMVPLIKEALVEKKKWLSDEEFVDALAIAQSTPGKIVFGKFRHKRAQKNDEIGRAHV